jgi:RNA polymerase sigma factor (sigma-70 family)
MEAVWNAPGWETLFARIRVGDRETAETLPLKSEIDLVRAARRGDRAAFARIVELHKDSVYGVATRLVGPADAFDVSQEAFLRAFQRLATFDAQKPLRPWLLAIAHHCCVDEFRRRRRQSLFPAALDQPEHARLAHPDDAIETREQGTRVVAALNHLPDNQREALLLFHQDQLSYRDIAVVLGVPIGTVMTWIHRARRALRAELEASK